MSQPTTAPSTLPGRADAPVAPAPSSLVPMSAGVVVSPGSMLATRSTGHMHEGLDISPATGEVRRPRIVAVAAGVLYTGVAVLLYALARIWWHSVQDVFHAARIIEWIKPEVSSWQALISPVICALIGLAIGIPAATSAHFGWNGYKLARVGATVATVVSAATWLLTPWAMASIPFFALGAALLWLPRFRRYADDQATLRFRRWAVERHAVPRTLFYGPLPRYRD